MFAQIDWRRPWYNTVRPAFDSLEPSGAGHPIGRIVGDGGRTGPFIDAFNANAARLGLVNHRGQPLRFVPQAALPPDTAYEEFIGATGGVPTRDNLHDFFNGLVWQTFPRIKRELNALQAAQIAAAGVGKSRGPARDAATIFDENAALLVVRDDGEGRALVDALRAHEWLDALLMRRALFGPAAQAWLFGHALMEKLVAPRPAITAHTRVLFADAGWFALPWDERRDWIDRSVATALAAEGVSNAAFTPLQVLGVPGWWPDQDAAFYADRSVFRPRRQPQPAGSSHNKYNQENT
ncbi:DUF3025 domain-containing protein [Massilia forsythiae]|uniref:DUF3025 domain-containing protein n=1 Tax=Massilia forsythiae TaxID=2728020 RepID=A0A7Z2ZSA1_9BURK|nr:DUF3025 domain-containing protein [Massilia forsythiae]QJE00283.1 DUF3025 domain-containing protein [Massilia forsythiae]